VELVAQTDQLDLLADVGIDAVHVDRFLFLFLRWSSFRLRSTLLVRVGFLFSGRFVEVDLCLQLRDEVQQLLDVGILLGNHPVGLIHRLTVSGCVTAVAVFLDLLHRISSGFFALILIFLGIFLPFGIRCWLVIEHALLFAFFILFHQLGDLLRCQAVFSFGHGVSSFFFLCIFPVNVQTGAIPCPSLFDQSQVVNADVALYSVIGLPLPLPWDFLQIEAVPQRELPQPVIQLARIVDDDLRTDVIAVLRSF